MRQLLLSCAAAMSALVAQAQPTVISTFDTLNLSQPDTFYVNYSAPGTDVGFQDGYAWFPCVYDTAFGFQFWSYGFAYSNMTDTSTSGIVNQYAARTGSGYNSSQYGIVYGNTNSIKILAQVHHKATGFYVTNTTYAYNSMRDGDMFAKKFGGVTGNDPDWFKLRISSYNGGMPQGNGIEFYLADFRDTNNANDYILDTWEWVDLSLLPYADSLVLELSSSDTGQFGMNTPAYFAMDDFTLQQIIGSATTLNNPPDLRIYPNPAASTLNIAFSASAKREIAVYDLSGKVLTTSHCDGSTASVAVDALPPGLYLLQVMDGQRTASIRFQKQ